MNFPLIYPIVDIHYGLFSVVVVDQDIQDEVDRMRLLAQSPWRRATEVLAQSVEKICRYLQLVMANDC
jgi:hypothetical protein